MTARIFDVESDQFPPLASEKLFIAKIRDYHSVVSTHYYDPRVEAKVKQVVPWEKLNHASCEKALLLSRNASSLSREAGHSSSAGFAREIFIMELIDWFKNDFFSWFDHGICCNSSCQRFGQPMSARGSGQPTLEDVMWGASRVEMYQCKLCGSEERFPRYNHPLKLLETRKGRCGEWANAITCICTVLGYEARLVLDLTDHVWTEIYSEQQERWIHVDSCEKALDSPLLYETGWGKQLTYCIAISRSEIQDVTWRYVSDPKAVLARRNLCREAWLYQFILRVNQRLQRDERPERRVQLMERCARQ